MSADDKLLKQMSNMFRTFQQEIIQQVDQRIDQAVPTARDNRASRASGTSEVEPVRRGRGRPKLPALMQAPVQETAPPPVQRSLSLRERIELALTEKSMTPAELAKFLKEPLAVVQDEVVKLRTECRIFNVGMGEDPVFTWRIGNNTDTPTLRRVVKRLISERPMSTRELAAATLAKESRVSGCVVELQRSFRDRVLDLGGGHAGRWLLLAESVRPASLAPRRPKV